MLGLALVLAFAAPPGAFTKDESNYLVTVKALAAGGLALPGSEGLRPSPELRSFDPRPHLLPPRQPVYPSAPPLYAFLALPFWPLGWRGLVLLNALGFLLSGVLVHRLVCEAGGGEAGARLAAGAALGGGYLLEYALGVWPHMLATALFLGGLLLAGRARREDRWGPALGAGLVLGVAGGVRYASLLLAAGVGLGLLLGGGRRVARALAFGVGLAAPLLLSAACNQVRLGVFHPFTKGAGYVDRSRTEASRLPPGPWGEALAHYQPPYASALVEGLMVTAARVLDQRLRPESMTRRPGIPWSGPTRRGAYLVAADTPDPVLKRALVQSCPWALLALLLLGGAWLRPGRAGAGELRPLGVVVAVALAVYGAYGFRRADGFCFNQRYLLEFVPMLAVVLGLAAPPRLAARPLAGGLLVGLALAGALVLGDPRAGWWQDAMCLLPLALGLALAAAARGPAFLPLLGVALGWGAVVHLGDDLKKSWSMRAESAAVAQALGPELPAGALVFASGRQMDALAPLRIESDVWFADGRIDLWRDAPLLAGDALAAGRRVLLLVNGLRDWEQLGLGRYYPVEVRRIPPRDGVPEVVLAELREPPGGPGALNAELELALEEGRGGAAEAADLARVLEARGQAAEAAEALYLAGRLALEEGSPALAEACAQALLPRVWNSPRGVLARALGHAAAGRAADALVAGLTGYRAGPKTPFLRRYLAREALRLQRADQVLGLLEPVLETSQAESEWLWMAYAGDRTRFEVWSRRAEPWPQGSPFSAAGTPPGRRRPGPTPPGPPSPASPPARSSSP